MIDEVGNIRIERMRSSYASFYDHEWSLKMIGLASGTKLETPVDTLLVHWKACAKPHALPWMIVKSLQNFGVGLLGKQDTMGRRLTLNEC